MARFRKGVASLAGVVCVGALAACASLVGLDDYEKVECTGLRCDGGVLLDGATEASADGGPEVDAAGTKPVQWPQFRIPNYPQAGDAGPRENLASYVGVDGGVFETVSKLTWREPAEDGTVTFAEAQARCASLTAGGAKWRLPSRIELITLLDLRSTPAIDRAVFPSAAATAYWTSSESRPYGSPRRRWTVDFGANAGPTITEETGRAGVRCIKDL